MGTLSRRPQQIEAGLLTNGTNRNRKGFVRKLLTFSPRPVERQADHVPLIRPDRSPARSGLHRYKTAAACSSSGSTTSASAAPLAFHAFRYSRIRAVSP